MGNINYSLSFDLGEALRKKGLKVSLAESCTGGGLAEELTAVSGSTDYFDRSFVVYSNEAKEECLGVSRATLEQHGAVSEEVAEEMALGVLRKSNADFAISITGVAGPKGGTVAKPVGMVCFGLAKRDEYCFTKTEYFTSGRKNIRRNAVRFALQWLLDAVSK